MELSEELRGYEEELLTEVCRRDAQRIEALLSPEFREFGSSGRIFTRADLIRELQLEPPSVLSMENFEVISFEGRHALVTYRSRRRTAKGADLESLRSSI